MEELSNLTPSKKHEAKVTERHVLVFSGHVLVKSAIFSDCLFIPRWGSKTFLGLRQQCESSRLKRAPRFID